MNQNLIDLIERNADEEMKAYFGALGSENPLDCHEELVLLEHFSPVAVKSYINRFRFSETAEISFIDKAPADIRLAYVNYYGLRDATQKHVIKNNLRDAAKDFMRMRHFNDIDYLLDNGSPEIIRPYLSLNKLEKEEQVRKLLHADNNTLFYTYACKWYISENIKREIIEEQNFKAFEVIMYKFYRLFRQKSKKATDFNKLMASTLAAEMLPEDLQVEVLTSYNRSFIELLLKTTPLAPNAQDTLWRYNYDPEWLKFHVEHLYCLGGYRFTPENEVKLFKALASKSLDDCLTTFRQQDDTSFVKFASRSAVGKYVKNFWLSDDAQVALIARGESTLIKELVSRYSPEHGMCWQAEVELVKLFSEELIKEYMSFHSMCWEALQLLKEKSQPLVDYYYALHQY